MSFMMNPPMKEGVVTFIPKIASMGQDGDEPIVQEKEFE